MTPARLIAAATELQTSGLVWLLWEDGRDAVIPADLYVRMEPDQLRGVRAFLEATSFLRAVSALEQQGATLS